MDIYDWEEGRGAREDSSTKEYNQRRHDKF